MAVTNTYDVVNPAGGLSAINELIQAHGVQSAATLTLRPVGSSDADLFTLVVSEVKIRHDAVGLILLDAVSSQGIVTGRLLTKAAPGQPAGSITVQSEGPNQT